MGYWTLGEQMCDETFVLQWMEAMSPVGNSNGYTDSLSW